MANPTPSGFNFGPELGPIAPSKKLIYVAPNPLEPGYWLYIPDHVPYAGDGWNPDAQIIDPGLTDRDISGGWTGVGDRQKDWGKEKWRDFGPQYSPGGWWNDTIRVGGVERAIAAPDPEQADIIKAAIGWIMNNKACFDSIDPDLALCMLTKYQKSQIGIQIEPDHCTPTAFALISQFPEPTPHRISLCAHLFQFRNTLTVPILARALMHELIHLCGGSELDAYAITALCDWDPDSGGPTQAELDAMDPDVSTSRYRMDRYRLPGIYKTKYFIWDPCTGQLWVRMPGPVELGREVVPKISLGRTMGWRVTPIRCAILRALWNESLRQDDMPF